ncbi:MAG: metallophosphoesterase [Bradymonadaceae bacterium]|nr:metallophosphoesterase [Lujinxingiaceae bacterium]
MPDAIFQWIDCTDKKRPRALVRPADSIIRIAQLTDLHVPSEIELGRRLRDLISPHASINQLTYDLSAISNEIGHSFRTNPRLYLNMIKKTLAGLHKLGVDHLLITGDLVHCGLATEFLDIRAALEVTGWWGEERLTVVPGNHDRFNLYEHVPDEPMEAFFPVVTPRKPRFKVLPHGVALLEIDSNRDPVDDRHYLEKWLPNTVGRIYPQALDWIESNHAQVAGNRLLTLVHHHITSDWYPRRATTFGLMDPAEGVPDLIDAIDLTDPHSIILHGHKHDVMPVNYTHGTHPVACPGGFASEFRLNMLDFDVHGEHVMTQLEVRTPHRR